MIRLPANYSGAGMQINSRFPLSHDEILNEFVAQLQIYSQVHLKMNRIKIFKTIFVDVLNVIEIYCTRDVLAGDPNKPVRYSFPREHKLFINWVQRE
jgi:hypothetical protein